MAYTPTPDQKQAIETVDRNVVVVAGAGSGKTRVLVDRYLYLLRQGVGISQILAITFTRKAALEMKDRIRSGLAQIPGLPAGLAQEFNQAQISTIHSFCQHLVADHPDRVHVDPRFRTAEEWESRGLLFQVVQEQVDWALASKEPGIAAIRETYRQTQILVRDLVDIYQRIVTKGVHKFTIPDRAGALQAEVTLLRQELRSRLVNWLKYVSQTKLSDSKKLVVADIGSLFREYESGSGDQSDAEQELLAELARLFGGSWAKDLKAEVQDLRALCNELRQCLIDLDANQILVELGEFLTRVDQEYHNRKKAAGILDFNDLEQLAVELLANTRVDQAYQFRHVMVDETQDINPVQKQLISLLTKNPGTKLFVVGDPKQSIYRFRGAQVEVFIDLHEEIQQNGGQLITLKDNFRSRPQLIAFNNQLFSQVFANDPIGFSATNAKRESTDTTAIDLLIAEKGENIELGRAAEARQIAAYIQRLVTVEGYDYKDITLLFRSMSPVGIYERELHNHQIPFVNLSGRGFYEKQEIQDVLSFIQWLQDSANGIAEATVLRSPFFGVSDEGLYWYRTGKFDQICAEDRDKLERAYQLYPQLQQELVLLPAPQFLDKLLETTNFREHTRALPLGEQRLANINKLKETSWQLWAKGYVSFTEQLAYIDQFIELQGRESEAALDHEHTNVVTLMTIHGAKGLEFPVVILPDLCGSIIRSEQGSLHFHPDWGLTLRDTTQHQQIKAALREEAVAEAKRLLYVAMTRAKEKLALSGIGEAGDYQLEPPLENLRSWWEWILFGLPQVDPDLVQIITGLELPEPIQVEIAATAELEPKDKPRLMTSEQYAQASFSATSLMIYSLCPRRYYYRYILRVPELVFKPGKVHTAGLDPLQRGNIVHRVCEHLAKGTDLEKLLDWAIAMEGISIKNSERQELHQIITRYLASDYYVQSRGHQVDREVEFAVPLDRFVITGTVDQAIHTDQGLVIVDLKTNQIGADQIEDTAATYGWQLRIYAWALQVMTGQPVVKTGLYFLFPDLVYFAPDSYLDTKATEQWLTQVCRQIQAGEKVGVEAFPMSADCQYCPYDCQQVEHTRASFAEIVSGLGKLEFK